MAYSTLPTVNPGDIIDSTTWGNVVKSNFAQLWPFTTKGDLLVALGATTADRLAVGTDDYVLTAASGEATGMKWAAPANSILATNTTEQTLSSGAATDMVTVSGLSIAAGTPFRVKVQFRKSAAAFAVGIGIKVNSTVIYEASTTAGYPSISNVNAAVSGIAIWEFWPGETNYERMVTYSYFTARTDGGGINNSSWSDAAGATFPPNPAGLPVATITSITIRGISNASITLAVKNVVVEAI